MLTQLGEVTTDIIDFLHPAHLRFAAYVRGAWTSQALRVVPTSLRSVYCPDRANVSDGGPGVYIYLWP